MIEQLNLSRTVHESYCQRNMFTRLSAFNGALWAIAIVKQKKAYPVWIYYQNWVSFSVNSITLTKSYSSHRPTTLYELTIETAVSVKWQIVPSTPVPTSVGTLPPS